MEKKFLVWSIEHTAWWAPNQHGYTTNRARAGRYSFTEALDIVSGANFATGNEPKEAMLPDPDDLSK